MGESRTAPSLGAAADTLGPPRWSTLLEMLRRHWLSALLVFVGIGFASLTWVLTQPARPPSQWPSYFAWDPATGALALPTSGPAANQSLILEGWLDRAMPFVAPMALPYLAALLLCPVGVPLLTLSTGSWRRFLTLGSALALGGLVRTAGLLINHTLVVRDVDPSTVPLGWMADLVYKQDHLSMDGWPSGHAMWATMAIIAVWRMRSVMPRTAAVLIIVMLLVFPATLMLRQHYLMDVYTGALLGFAAYWACMFVVERPVLQPTR